MKHSPLNWLTLPSPLEIFLKPTYSTPREPTYCKCFFCVFLQIFQCYDFPTCISHDTNSSICGPAQSPLPEIQHCSEWVLLRIMNYIAYIFGWNHAFPLLLGPSSCGRRVSRSSSWIHKPQTWIISLWSRTRKTWRRGESWIESWAFTPAILHLRFQLQQQCHLLLLQRSQFPHDILSTPKHIEYVSKRSSWSSAFSHTPMNLTF